MKKLSLAIALILSACSVSALYDTRKHDNMVSKMEKIAIAPVAGEDGVWGIRMRNSLLDRLTPRGAPEEPRYTLKIKVHPPARLDYTMDRYGTATSYALRIGADYELLERGGGASFLKGSVSASSSYPILRDQYSSETLRADAQALVIEDLADQIYLAVVVWLSEEGR